MAAAAAAVAGMQPCGPPGLEPAFWPGAAAQQLRQGPRMGPGGDFPFGGPAAPWAAGLMGGTSGLAAAAVSAAAAAAVGGAVPGPMLPAPGGMPGPLQQALGLAAGGLLAAMQEPQGPAAPGGLPACWAWASARQLVACFCIV